MLRHALVAVFLVLATAPARADELTGSWAYTFSYILGLYHGAGKACGAFTADDMAGQWTYVQNFFDAAINRVDWDAPEIVNHRQVAAAVAAYEEVYANRAAKPCSRSDLSVLARSLDVIQEGILASIDVSNSALTQADIAEATAGPRAGLAILRGGRRQMRAVLDRAAITAARGLGAITYGGK